MVRRRHLIEMHVAELNRLQQSHESQLASIQHLIDTLGKLIAELDKDINDYSRYLNDKAEFIADIKGVGKNTVAVLMSNLSELGKLSGKKITSLVGVIPHPRESASGKVNFFAQAVVLLSAMRYIWQRCPQVGTKPFLKPFMTDWSQEAKRRKSH